MIVSLRDRVAMTVIFSSTLGISGDYARVRFRVMLGQPGQQGRTKIKTNPRVVIDEFFFSLGDNSHSGIREVTLRVDALVPIVKRLRAGFGFDCAGPRIFPRWLVKMAVND